MTAVQPAHDVTPKFVEEITMAELEADPYPFYERLRKEAPVAFVPSLGMYIVSTRELCMQIAKDSDNWPAVISPAGGRTFGHGALLNTNGPEHRDLRDMVEPHLQPSAVDNYIDDLVRPYARELLERIEDNGSAESSPSTANRSVSGHSAICSAWVT